MDIYMNNAATTWPKPGVVSEAMFEFTSGKGANLSRGSASKRDLDTMDTVLECRIKLSEMFGGYRKAQPKYVTFNSNVTEALNVILFGFLKPKMSVLSSSMEHNAVVRPLRKLQQMGVDVNFLKCDSQGYLDTGALNDHLTQNKTDLVVLNHASNVCGTIQDLQSIASICKNHGVRLVVDCAQTAGVLPINVSELGLSAMCFTGHKGLFGPQGTGGIIWEPEFSSLCDPLILGGTGSFSHQETQPAAMPDKYESGTPNLPGVVGLNAALSWINQTGTDKIHAKEAQLGKLLLDGLKTLPGIKIYGKTSMEGRLPVFSINFEDLDNGVLASQLSLYNVETRPGLHCSPMAHATLGSFPEGSLRLSPGYFTTEEEIEITLNSLKRSLNDLRD